MNDTRPQSLLVRAWPVTSSLPSILAFTAIPVAATLLGGLIATVRIPSAQLRSFVQHFAAGVVFAAVAGELIPEIKKDHEPLGVVIGFSIGVALMLGIRWWTARGEANPMGVTGPPGEATGNPNSLIAAVGIDVLIDGLLIGVSFAAGARAGALLTVALTLELLFLALATVASLTKVGAKRTRVLSTVSLMAGLLVLGAIIGGGLLAGLKGLALEIVLSFGASPAPASRRTTSTGSSATFPTASMRSCSTSPPVTRCSP